MRQWIAWTIAGLIVGAMAAYIAVVAAGGGHGSYLPAAVLFPISMSLATWVGSITPVLMGIGLVQYPLYGSIVALLRPPRRTLIWIVCGHIAIAALAVFLVSQSDSFTWRR